MNGAVGMNANTSALAVDLKTQQSRAERLRSVTSFLLTGPYLLFILITFALPIALMLARSIQNPELSETLPATATAFREWRADGMPPEELVRIFVRDVAQARENQTIALVAKRLNFEIPGFRGILLHTARDLPDPQTTQLLRQLVEIDVHWGEPRYWAAIKHAAPRYTVRYLLATLDREFAELLERVNAELEDHEQLDYLAVVRDQWTMDNGFLTPTMKIKRNVIEKHYESKVEKWYGVRQPLIWDGA